MIWGTGAGEARGAVDAWWLGARELPPRRAVCFTAYCGAGAELSSDDADILALFAAFVLGGDLEAVSPGTFVLIATLTVTSVFLFPVVDFREDPACVTTAGSKDFAAFLSSLSRFVHSFFSRFSKSVIDEGTDRAPPRTASNNRMRATDFILEGLSP
jgi:hypothetical protein